VLCVPAVRAPAPEPGSEQYLRERGEWIEPTGHDAVHCVATPTPTPTPTAGP
jgi:hypothetical protein